MKCLVTSSRAVQKNERGFCDYYSDKNVVLMQWNDNRVVYMASNFVGVQPIKAVKRFSQRQKKKKLMFLSPTVLSGTTKGRNSTFWRSRLGAAVWAQPFGRGRLCAT